MKVVITGCAGFIGYHLSKLCLSKNYTVFGIDNLNEYYDVNLKKDRLKRLQNNERFNFQIQNISDYGAIKKLLSKWQPDYIIHLAAQAGVRYSLENPFAYVESNLQGFTSIIEAAKEISVKHFLYASSSSVYGANTAQPFSEKQSLNHPLSLYAATKKSNELIAHSYSNLFGLPTTGLRFFTVYGPWGRPDMALFMFTKNILESKPINVYNHGDLIRDFTYVDDVVEAVYQLISHIPESDNLWDSQNPDPSKSFCPYRIYNVGNSRPIQLNEYIKAIEHALNKKALVNYMPMQPGDVRSTFADVTELHAAINYRPTTPIAKGVNQFVKWYLEYNGIKQGDVYA